MDDVADAHDIPYMDFENINEPMVVKATSEWAPDLLFVIGLSQMVKRELMSVPTRGAVGFHPTWLPKGRGRAPVAWLTWDGAPGAATFFVLEETPDSGPLLVQEPFFIGKDFYAERSIDAVRSAIDRALDRWIPSLVAGEWAPQSQDHGIASFFGRRAPADGLIDWRRPAVEIGRLVRTSSRPYPGAYTYTGDSKVVIWRARVEETPHRGVTGRILDIDAAGNPLIQAGRGLLRVEDFELDPYKGDGKGLRVGIRLGLSAEDEIVELKHQIDALTQRLESLERRSD